VIVKNKKKLLPVLLSVAPVCSLILLVSMVNTAPVMARGQATLVVATDTTVSAENYSPPECDVGDWTDIIQVAAGGGNTVGLKSDGTVVTAGDNEYGQCNVGHWPDIIQVAAGGGSTVGLKSDGTVVAVGYNGDGQCDVGNWTDIIQVAAGLHTVGLKSDGTVVAVGYNGFGQCDVGNWADITQVAAGEYHTVGLKSDGTVVAAGGYVCCSLPSSRCFIATAAYGTPMAGEIEILRQFRDEYLFTNPVGQALVGLYYRISPPIAEFITEHASLKPIVRAGLVPVIAMTALALSTSPAQKTAIIDLLVMVSVAMALWAMRQRASDAEYT
jgi:alpha-tubulin suppressor-like RCC1 family protein